MRTSGKLFNLKYALRVAASCNFPDNERRAVVVSRSHGPKNLPSPLCITPSIFPDAIKTDRPTRIKYSCDPRPRPPTPAGEWEKSGRVKKLGRAANLPRNSFCLGKAIRGDAVRKKYRRWIEFSLGDATRVADSLRIDCKPITAFQRNRVCEFLRELKTQRRPITVTFYPDETFVTDV